MNEMTGYLEQWQFDINQVRDQMYRAPTARERERWHALWLLAQEWSAARVAKALERDPHTVGEWLESFRQRGPSGMAFDRCRQRGGAVFAAIIFKHAIVFFLRISPQSICAMQLP